MLTRRDSRTARAGTDVLCEKSLDVYADRIDKTISVCEEEGVTLAGVFQKRAHESAQAARGAVEDGELGELILGDTHVKWFRSQGYYDSGGWRGTRDMDCGAMMNQAIHAIDRLQWLMGGVESVTALTDTLARDVECEDTAAVALRFGNGALGTIEATTAVVDGTDRTEINGTEGTTVLQGQSLETFAVGTSETTDYGAETEDRDFRSTPSTGPGRTPASFRTSSTRSEGRDPMVPAREAVDVILAADESAERGEPVALSDVRGD